MKSLLILAATYVAFTLQSSLAPEIAIRGFVPHFVLLALTLITLQLGGTEGVLWAAGWGLLSDCFAPAGFGVDAICFLWVAFAVQQVRSYANSKSPLAFSLSCGSVTCAALCGSTAVRLWNAGQPIEIHHVLSHAAGVGAYTGVIGVGLILILRLGGISRPQLPRRTPESPRVANRWRMLTE